MEENERFKLFSTDFDGTRWYMCLDCGAKSRGKPRICPVCENKVSIITDEARQMIDAVMGGTKCLKY